MMTEGKQPWPEVTGPPVELTVVEVDITADVTRFDAAMRRAVEATARLARLLSTPAMHKALRKAEIQQRKRRQQMRYRDQRAARRARRRSS
jgi:hypothetical protein